MLIVMSVMHSRDEMHRQRLPKLQRERGAQTFKELRSMLSGLGVAGDDFARVEAHADEGLGLHQQLAGKRHHKIGVVSALCEMRN